MSRYYPHRGWRSCSHAAELRLKAKNPLPRASGPSFLRINSAILKPAPGSGGETTPQGELS